MPKRFNQNDADDHLAATGWLELDKGMVGAPYLHPGMDLSGDGMSRRGIRALIYLTGTLFQCASNRVLARRLYAELAATEA